MPDDIYGTVRSVDTLDILGKTAAQVRSTLFSGTPTGSKFARDDGTWATPPAPDLSGYATTTALNTAVAAAPTLAGNNTLSGSNTFSGGVTNTGGLTLSGANGLAMRIPAPSGTAGRYFTISSSWNGAYGGDDEAFFLGHNMNMGVAGSNRGRIDSSRGAAMLGIEAQYKAYVGAPYQDEYYFQTVTTGNKVYRSLMSELRWDGTAQNYLGGNLALIPVIDNDLGVGALHWSYDSSDGSLSSYGKRLVQRSNNVGWLQQWDSSGTPANLIYLDGSNVAQIGGTGGTQVYGPVATPWSLLNSSGHTLNNNIPIRSYNSGGTSPVNLIVRNADGSVSVGAASVLNYLPGQTYCSYTPVSNGDTPLNIPVTMTGNSTNFYGMKVAATFNATNSGSVHYLAQFAGNSTYAANGPTVTAVRANLTANAASAYLPDATGFEYQGGAAGGFIGLQTGLKIKTPTATGGGFHSTTFYGVLIEDITGPTNPYAWYSGAGYHRFGSSSARIGFFGATPVVKQAALTGANAGTLNTGDATSDTIIGNMRTRIGDIEARLQSYGLIP